VTACRPPATAVVFEPCRCGGWAREAPCAQCRDGERLRAAVRESQRAKRGRRGRPLKSKSSGGDEKCVSEPDRRRPLWRAAFGRPSILRRGRRAACAGRSGFEIWTLIADRVACRFTEVRELKSGQGTRIRGPTPPPGPYPLLGERRFVP
jgi:hypothetical protein